MKYITITKNIDPFSTIYIDNCDGANFIIFLIQIKIYNKILQIEIDFFLHRTFVNSNGHYDLSIHKNICVKAVSNGNKLIHDSEGSYV